MKSKGFTMVEVMIALAIFGIAVTVLSQAIFNTLVAQGMLEDKGSVDADIAFVRQQVLQIPTREEMEDGGEVSTLASGTATWEVELEDTDVVDVLSVKLMVELPENENGPTGPFERNFKIFRPNWMEASTRQEMISDLRQRIQDERLDR